MIAAESIAYIVDWFCRYRHRLLCFELRWEYDPKIFEIFLKIRIISIENGAQL